MSGTGSNQNKSPAIAGRQTTPAENSEKQWREARTRLNKHILKLIFSHLGRNEDLDNSIREFKTQVQQTNNENDRDKLFDTAINNIIQFADKEDLTRKQTDKEEIDLFIELLNKLAISHENADEFIKIKKRLKNIQQHQDHLEVINETIKLLTSKPGTSQSDNKELVLNLVEYIRLPKDAAVKLEEIKQQIHRNKEPAGLVKLLKNISEVINQTNEKLQSEYFDIRRYITSVIGQLGQINEFLTNSMKEQQAAFTESRELKNEFIDRNESLQLKIDSTSDVEEIKNCVNLHIKTVNENLKTHIEIEIKRYADTEKRLKSMKKELNGVQKRCDLLKTKLQKAKKDAMHDVLTGLPNRLSYEERIKEEQQRYERYLNPYSLAVIDIDHFKRVNDTYGHKAGDKVLMAVAEVCNNNIRETDFLCRFGGEEFVLLMSSTRLEQAMQAMENLRTVIQDCHFHYSDQTVPITVSIGIAECREGETSGALFKRADEALYAAKGGGRNCCKSEQHLESAA